MCLQSARAESQDLVIGWSQGATLGQLAEAWGADSIGPPDPDGLASPHLAVEGCRHLGDTPSEDTLLDDVLDHQGLCLTISFGENRAGTGGGRSQPFPCGPVRRSARRSRRPPPLDLDVPAPEVPTERAPKLSWFALLAPAAAAVVMAMLFSPVFALFGALGPVMVLGRWWDSRRSFRRARKRFDHAVAEARAGVIATMHDHRDSLRAHLASTNPRLSTWLGRAWSGDATLWQRRVTHADAATVTLGLAGAGIRWSAGPPAVLDMADMLETWGYLSAVPATVDLCDGGVAFIGDGSSARSAARSVLAQLVCQVGPADLQLLVATAGRDTGVSRWEWCAWLPHLAAAAPTLAGPSDGDDVIRVIVVDGVTALEGLARSEREAIEQGRLVPLLVLDAIDELPPGCATAVHCDRFGGGVVIDGRTGDETELDVCDRLDEPTARQLARSLARRSDPDVCDARLLPPAVALTSLRPVETPRDLRARWQAASSHESSSLTATLGVGGDGPLTVDLVADGPHALVAGTTGAGKSELLRTLVIGLSLEHGPDVLAFVLVDFKGGGGLDAVSGLPHCAAVVSDLDDHLASRALRSLRAEVRSRERIFRDCGVGDIGALRRAGRSMPSLVVVVDEFATLAAELPDFLESLVDIAQRGRSLGLHLILATQRPGGVVDAKIRANTNLRISLRVQDERDSLDVVDVVRAAELPRHVRGRALIRRGAGDLIEFQTAYVSGSTPLTPMVEVAPLTLSNAVVGGQQDPTLASAPGPLDVERYTEAARAAWGADPTPPPPWLPPLPLEAGFAALRDVAAEVVRPTASSIPVGVCDDPDRQCRTASWWDPCEESLLLYGGGVDRSAALAAVVVTAADRNGPDDLHVYVIAESGSPLCALGGLPHAGGVIDPYDLEELERLTLLLERLLERRVFDHAPAPLLVLEDLGSVIEALNEAGRPDVSSRLTSLLHGARRGGVTMATGATDVRALPLRVTQSFEVKLSRPLSDPASLSSLGMAELDLELAATRGVDLRSGLELAMVLPEPAEVSERVAGVRSIPARRPPVVLESMPSTVSVDDLGACARRAGRQLIVPVGLQVADLEPAVLSIDDCCVVLGAPGTGRTSMLASVHQAVRGATDLVMGIVGDDLVTCLGSPAVNIDPGAGRLPEGVDLWLVDDAERIDDGLGRALVSWCRELEGRWLLAAARPEALRDGLHWLAGLRTATAGCLLAPQQGDGDPLRTVLPLRGAQRWAPGRGFTITRGFPQLVQFVCPDAEVRRSLSG